MPFYVGPPADDPITKIRTERVAAANRANGRAVFALGDDVNITAVPAELVGQLYENRGIVTGVLPNGGTSTLAQVQVMCSWKDGQEREVTLLSTAIAKV